MLQSKWCPHVSKKVQEWACGMSEGMEGWVNAWAVANVLKEPGPAKVTEQAPKGAGQLTEIACDCHALVWVTGGCGVGWPWVFRLWRTLAPPSRAGGRTGYCTRGACALKCSGHKAGEDGLVGWRWCDMGLLAVAVLIARAA